VRLLLCLAVILGCASTRPRPIAPLPPLVELGRHPPPAPPPRPKLPRYPDTPVYKGDCKDLPTGMLVSHASYADFTEALIDRQRLQVQAATLERLRGEEHAIALRLDEAYRQRVAQLERDLATEALGSKWKYAATAIVAGSIVLVSVYAARVVTR
jgi:hypothetical protein